MLRAVKCPTPLLKLGMVALLVLGLRCRVGGQQKTAPWSRDGFGGVGLEGPLVRALEASVWAGGGEWHVGGLDGF